MATVGDIVAEALSDAGVIGVGQTAAAEDANRSFNILNQLLAQWSRKRWLVYHLIDVFKVSTGALSYTIGPGGDFNTPRPDRLESAFFRQIVPSGSQQIDYMLQIIQSREDYNRIVLKTMGTWPSQVFYDSDYPLGNIFVWPVPQASLYEIHLTLKQTLSAFTNLAQTINLPPEYEAALRYNLAARLRPSYQLPPDPSIIGLAKDALNTIRGANVQIATLTMPSAVTGNKFGYNVYSDNN